MYTYTTHTHTRKLQTLAVQILNHRLLTPKPLALRTYYTPLNPKLSLP